MSITDNFTNLFYNQNKITIVVAFVFVLTIEMTIQPSHQSVAQLVDMDEILKNVLASSNLDILNDSNICSINIGIVGSFDSLLGENNQDSVCLIVKEILGEDENLF